jgi:phosphoribosylformimino-5-aminoimidazole carboxamide ribotide isomerase
VFLVLRGLYNMVILPAIDLKDGKCVRLRQGRADDVTVYGSDPVMQARDWREQGGEELHLVDLDGAFNGVPAHLDVIKDIIKEFAGPVEVGGGIRTPEALRAILEEAQAARAIIGSAALEDPEFLVYSVELYGDRIAVGIDARDGFVQTKGWVNTTKVKAVELAAAVEKAGVKTIIYTDTATDGMLGGPNLTQLASICDAAPGCMITASGGVSSPYDVENLKALGRSNLRAAIVGKALYDGKTTLREMNVAAI